MTLQFPFFLVAGSRIPTRRFPQSQVGVVVEVCSEASPSPLLERSNSLFPSPVMDAATVEQRIDLFSFEPHHPENEARLFLGDDMGAVSLDVMVDVDQNPVRLLLSLWCAAMAIVKSVVCWLPYRFLADGTSLTATDLKPRFFGFAPLHEDRVYRVAVWREPLPYPVYSGTIHSAKRAVTVSNELTSYPVSGIGGGF